MTMEVYAEASQEEVWAALGKLSAALGGASPDGGRDVLRAALSCAVRSSTPRRQCHPGMETCREWTKGRDLPGLSALHINDLSSPFAGVGRSTAHAVEGPPSCERDEGPSACRGRPEGTGSAHQLPGLRAGPTSKGT